MINIKKIKDGILVIENFYSILVIFLIFFLDRYSKIYIISNFSDSIYYINNYLNFSLTWNTGVGFGLFSSESTLIYNSISILVGIVLIILTYFAIKAKNYEKITFAIVIGGALGNFYDRLFFNAVPDFIDLHYQDNHWFTFNIADIFISIGLIFYITSELFVKKNEKI